jgi:hypothetical protein
MHAKQIGGAVSIQVMLLWCCALGMLLFGHFNHLEEFCDAART